MSGGTPRVARIEDAPEMPAIEREAAALFAGHPELGTLDPDDTWSADELIRLIRRGHCLVSHVGHRTAGFLIAKPSGRELHLWEVSVAPAFQRRGIGAGLVRACLIDARNAGFAAVTLTTFRALPWNGPFYTRLGFREVEQHRRLDERLAQEAAHGLARELRCAMVCALS